MLVSVLHKSLSGLCCSLLLLFTTCTQNTSAPAYSTTDSVRIAGLYEKGKEALRTGDTTTAQNAFEAGLRESVAARAALLQGFGWAYLTLYHTETGHYDAAETTGKKALHLFDSLRYKKTLYLQTRLALLSQLGLGTDHLRLTKESLKILEEAKTLRDTPSMARALSFLSWAGTQMIGDARDLRHMEEAVSLLRQASDKSRLPQTLNNLGVSYLEAGRTEEALAVLREALTYPKPNRRVDGYTYGYIGQAFMELGEPDSALYYLQKSGAVARQYNEPKIAVNLQGMYGALYLSEGRYRQAVAAYDSGIALMHQTGITALLPGYYQGKAEAYLGLGDYRGAFFANNVADSLIFGVQEESVQKEMAAIETRYQTREKEAAIQTLSQTTAQQRRWLAGIGGLLLVVAALAAVAALQYRKQRKTTRLVAAQAERLEWLMKEIHHRLKNNLQVITSLINMQIRKGQGPEATQVLSDTVIRINAIALIHQKLYQHTAGETVSVQSYFETLAAAIGAVHGPATVAVDAPLHLDTDTVVLLGLTLTELVTNSCKHARQPGKDLRITVQIQPTAEGYVLSYKDNGPGPAPGAGATENTLGVKIVQLMARQLGGTATYDATSGFGVTLTFKDEAQRRQIA